MKNIFTKILSIITFAALYVYGYLPALAQTPQDLPHPDDNEPLALDNWTNLIFFILIPLLFVVLYLWLRAKKKKDK